MVTSCKANQDCARGEYCEIGIEFCQDCDLLCHKSSSMFNTRECNRYCPKVTGTAKISTATTQSQIRSGKIGQFEGKDSTPGGATTATVISGLTSTAFILTKAEPSTQDDSSQEWMYFWLLFILSLVLLAIFLVLIVVFCCIWRKKRKPGKEDREKGEQGGHEVVPLRQTSKDSSCTCGSCVVHGNGSLGEPQSSSFMANESLPKLSLTVVPNGAIPNGAIPNGAVHSAEVQAEAGSGGFGSGSDRRGQSVPANQPLNAVAKVAQPSTTLIQTAAPVSNHEP